MAATFREKALFVVPDPPENHMVAPPEIPRNDPVRKAKGPARS
jgi:hypothetical protein